MAHTDTFYCDCCGLAVDIAQDKLCPRCQYPVQPEQERLFLERALSELKRVIRYGGASLSVTDLAWRYEGRLQFLASRKRREAAQSQADQSAQAPAAESALLQTPRAQEVAQLSTAAEPQPASARPRELAASVPVQSKLARPEAPAMPLAPAASMRGFSLSSDAVINIVAALGGFFILAGSLSFVLTTSNLWLSFLAVFLLHAIFGGAGLLTRRRVPLLRAVSPLYTVIFALLVPLVGFSAYRLVTNGLVELSPPALLTLAALYAAATYTMLAVTQRFVPFAYLSMVALLVGDLALASTLHLASWWWPCMAMLLAFPALLALPRASGEAWPFTEAWAILRTPLLALMYALVGTACLLLALMLFLSLALEGSYAPSLAGLRMALFVLSCLLFAWTTLWIWRTGRLTRTPLLAYMFLGVLALFGYALRLDLAGYVLLLAGAALAYHALVRLVGVRLAAYGLPELTLDSLAIGLSAFVMLLVASATPFQLVYRAYTGSPTQNTFVTSFASPFSSSFIPGSGFSLNLFSLGVCCLVTLDITELRADLSRIPSRAGWCWLLLLSGMLFASAYGLEVLFWQVSPLYAFLVLSLALLACTVLVRRFASPAWSNPLDMLTLTGIAFTLTLSLGQARDVTSGLLLGFAALLYGVLFAQRRPLPSLLSAGLLVLALPLLLAHSMLVFGLSLLLPLLAASMQRAGLFEKRALYADLFAWTLLGPALLYGFILIAGDISSGQSVFASWPGLHLTVVYELAILGVAWYATALIARVQLWLIPATLFWLLALLLPTNNFWTLTIIVPLLALGAACIDLRASVTWASPLYLAALCGSGMVAYTGLAQGHVTELSWVLLVFALLAYALGPGSGRMGAFWLTPLFATGAVVVAAALLGDLYRPPVVALVCAALGLAASRTELPARLSRRPLAALLYALPFYTTALAAAVLTGVYGALGDINRPFYGAAPAALLLYALLAFVVLLIERQPSWSWLVAVFACWAVLLTQHLKPAYIMGTGIGLILFGLLSGRLFQPAGERNTPAQRLAHFTWSWPWYVAFLIAPLVLMGQSYTPGLLVPVLLVFTLLATVVMLVERAPEFLVVPAGLAAWTLYLWLPSTQPITAIVVYTALCILLFATQFIWRSLLAATRWWPESSLHNAFSLGGLCLVLLGATNQGALSSSAGNLAHAGVFALVTLSLLLYLYGLLHPSTVARALAPGLDESLRAARLEIAHAVRHWCAYGAGLLLSLAVSWELLAFQQTRFDVLTLVPASYLIIVAPFILRNKALPDRHFLGQAVALVGSALLLLPSLWFSFNGADLLPTLLLLAEALSLLVLGLLFRLRIFILSSAALIVVGTLRMLFLSVPQSVPVLLMAFGSLLVLLATTLILSRHRLQAAWRRWE